MQKILIDTDPGQDIDDLLAIWFALLRPELDVVAITTVTWPAARRARLIKRLLRYLGRSDIPIGIGLDYPLRHFSAHEIEQQQRPVHSMNHASFAEPEDPRDEPGAVDAVDLITRTIEESPGQVALACIAPLTNIAVALQRRPTLRQKIPFIALMGGELGLNRAEHNIAFDAVAADIVLRSGIPLFMGTWDLTRKFHLTTEDCAAIRARGTPLAIAMADAIATWHPAHAWKPGPVMYDLFPMVHAFDRSLYTLKTVKVAVELTNTRTHGYTVASSDGAEVQVTTDLDLPRLRELYLSTILR